MEKILNKIVLLGILLLASTSYGQVRRIVLMEVATNSGCGNCAVSNEIMNNFYKENFGGVISLRYHAAWPDISDPMYADNPVDNDARTSYYGVTYTPQYFMDGASKGAADNEERMLSEMQSELDKGSPIWIDIYSNISPDSVKFTVSVKSFANINVFGLKLRTAIIERLKHYDVPPGSNGETEFPDVMRKLLPDFNGLTLPPLSVGDSVSYSFAYPVSSNWNWKDLAVVAWAQNDSTKEVLQANINIPTVIIVSKQPDFIQVNNNSVYNESYIVRNENNKPADITINVETNAIPAGWSHSFQPVSTVLPPHDSLLFADGFTTDSTNSIISLQYRVSNNEDYLHYNYRKSFFGATKVQDVVILNKNNEVPINTQLFPFLDSLRLGYASIGSFDSRHWASELDGLNIKSAMLFSGNSYPAYKKSDIEFLIGLQDSGIPVLVTGQKISYSRTDFTEATDFYDNYLDARFVAPDSDASIYSVSGNPITQSLDAVLSGYYPPLLEKITSRSGNSSPLFATDTAYNKTVALFNETANFKNVYLGFGIEQIENRQKRELLFHDIFKWFGLLQPDLVASRDEIPTLFSLSQNYPNPFPKNAGENPLTAIQYTVTGAKTLNGSAPQQTVTLKVYDILGREITTLVNKQQSPGKYKVSFNADNLPNGIYFYRLQSGKINITKKMIILR